MGKASSSKKVQRAAKAAGRPGAKKSYGWPLTIGAVVLLGVLLIVVTVSTNDDTEPGSPKVGEHWHAAYGIYDCDTYLPPQSDEGEDREGIHTHEDGLMHIHPFLTRVTGDGANLEAFGRQIGMEVGDTSFSIDGGLERSNGDDCDGDPGQVQLVTWDSQTDETPSVRRRNLSAYAPPDGSIWVLAFVPEGTEVPKPPSAVNLADPLAAEEGRAPVSQQQGGSTTTAVPRDNESTTTSAPAGDTSSTTSAPAEDSRNTSTSAP
jgi:hypothetical protein